MALQQEIGRLMVRLVGDGRQYQAMLVQGASATKAFAVKTAAMLKTVGAGMSSLGRTMALRVTAPLLIMGALAANAFAKFDQAMTESTSIMQVTTAQMDEMRESALKLSTSGQGAQGPEELAKSYFFLASAGKNAEQSIALLPTVMDFATAGAFDMALATDLLTDAQSALGLTSKDVIQDTANMAKVSDVLVKANTLANASVQQFSTALTSKAGAAMKSFNIPLEEGVAVLAAFADQGIKAELAGNSFSRMMLLMSKAARDNRAAFEKLKFSLFDVNGAVRPMGDLIANLETSLEGMSAKAKTAALAELGFNARVQGAILPLLGTSDAIKRYTRELEKAGGVTQEVSEKQMKSFSNRMKVFKNRVTAAGIEIGKTLAPMIEKLTKLVERGIDKWKELTPEMQKMIIKTAVLAAALGPILIIVGTLTASLGALLTPIGAITGGLAALAAGFVFLKLKYGASIDPLIDSLKLLGKTFVTLFNTVKPLLVGLGLGFVGALRAVTPVIEIVVGGLSEMAGALALIATKSAGAISAVQEFFGLKVPAQNVQRGLGAAGIRREGFGVGFKGGPSGGIAEGTSETLQKRTAEMNKLVAATNKATNAEEARKALELLAAQEKIDEPAEKLLKNLKDTTSELRGITGLQVKLRELQEAGANSSILNQIRAEEFFRKSLVKRNALMAEGKRITEGMLTPLEKFIAKRKDLQKLRDVGAIDKTTFQRAIEAAQKELNDLQEKAKIQLVILPPRAATQLGTLEAEQRLAAFRTAINRRPDKPPVQGPKAPIPVEIPNFQDLGNLDKLEPLFKAMAGSLELIAEKEPVELNEVDV